MAVYRCDVTSARETLEAAGIDIEPGNTEHEAWRASVDGATAVAYEDKVVVQGSQPQAIEAILEDAGGRAHLYFDGASRGNPGPAAIGWVLVSGEGVVAENGRTIDTATNNRAEYKALIAGLDAATEYGFEELEIRGDSELVVKQVRGEYDVNEPSLRECRAAVRERLASVERWSIDHVPREINERADNLANEALDA